MTFIKKVQVRKAILSMASMAMLAFFCAINFGWQTHSPGKVSNSDTAFVPKEIQDPQYLGIHKKPYYATLNAVC